MDIFDRPSLRERKKIGETSLSNIDTILRRRWVKPIKGTQYVPVLKVRLKDGREVWIAGKYHVNNPIPGFSPAADR